MVLKLPAAALLGLECVPVEVEVDVHRGQTNFHIVGLADAAIREATDRVRSAIKNSDFSFPLNHRILVNLAPADIPKEGAGYDLPIAVGLICASNKHEVDLRQSLLVGELALNGNVRHVSGILPLTLFARAQGFKELFVPAEDAPEALLVEGITVYAVKSLRAVMDHLLGRVRLAPAVPSSVADARPVDYLYDFAFIQGQEFAKRALEIAAAGGHNVLLSGPPGAGKTLLARAFPSLLPELTAEEALEVTKIYSVAGLLRGGLMRTRPFRAPHHTASHIALVGGGRVPRPGEISLAHRGVLFLDEVAEFPRQALESLRQPLEDGSITVARINGVATFPARFMLLASQNPCPCGYASDPDRACTCSPQQIMRYQKKLSGPLLDRLDLFIEVPRLKFAELTASVVAESSATVRGRVAAARAVQTARYVGRGWHANSELSTVGLKEFCQLPSAANDLLREAVERFKLSARSFHHILKVARTIADLGGDAGIGTPQVAEALQFRQQKD